MILGASAGWQAVEARSQVEELSAVRPRRVLALSSAWTGSFSAGAAERRNAGQDITALYGAFRNFSVPESALDLELGFDESSPDRFEDRQGHYRTGISGPVESVNERWARYGRGAALFSGLRDRASEPLTLRPGPGALFAPGRNIRDFSLEFWLYPNNMENGEKILGWSAVENQRILCEALKNRIRWTFQEFFSPPQEETGSRRGNFLPGRLSITLESRSVLTPRTWSHHLIRYNADSGLLEYLINGRIESTAHATSSGGEGGDVYTPRTNRDGYFILGSRFSGMIDEFRIYNRVINAPGRTALEPASRTALELPELTKFPRSGGRIETRTLDLGEAGSRVIRVEASGGRLSFVLQAGARYMAVKNTYTGRGSFRFPDDSALQFFIRTGEEPYRFGQSPWIPIVPGETLPSLWGRYIQLAVSFYPSGDCETSPYLEELRIIYESNDPPYPPSLVIAQAMDGAVDLSWRGSPDEDVQGYLVYYGTSSGVYYGQGAAAGDSPIDAGNRTSLRIEGLRNGTLYFFTVAAYDGASPAAPPRPGGNSVPGFHAGQFAREVSARPLRAPPPGPGAGR